MRRAKVIQDDVDKLNALLEALIEDLAAEGVPRYVTVDYEIEEQP